MSITKVFPASVVVSSHTQVDNFNTKFIEFTVNNTVFVPLEEKEKQVV